MDSRRDLFMREIEASAKLQHPNIIRIHDHGEFHPNVTEDAAFDHCAHFQVLGRDWLLHREGGFDSILAAFLAP